MKFEIDLLLRRSHFSTVKANGILVCLAFRLSSYFFSIGKTRQSPTNYLTNELHVMICNAKTFKICKCLLMFNVPCRMYVRSKHSPRLFFARLLTSMARCSEPVPSAHHTFQLALSCHHSPCPCPCHCPCSCSCSQTQGLLTQQLGEPQNKVNQCLSRPCSASFSTFLPSHSD